MIDTNATSGIFQKQTSFTTGLGASNSGLTIHSDSQFIEAGNHKFRTVFAFPGIEVLEN